MGDVEGEDEDEDAGTTDSLVTSVLLAGVDGDVCTTVVLTSWAASTDETVVRAEETLLWCPERCLHRDASAMGARTMPKRIAVDRNCILEKELLAMKDSSEPQVERRSEIHETFEAFAKE